MSPALAIRFTILMTLMPDADYAEVLAALLGDLVLVPWQRPYRVPAAAAACTWREALGPAPLERLRDRLLAGIDGEHREHGWRAVTAGDLETGSIDGSLIRVPDSSANREAFGSAGTASICTAPGQVLTGAPSSGHSVAAGTRTAGQTPRGHVDGVCRPFRGQVPALLAGRVLREGLLAPALVVPSITSIITVMVNVWVGR